MKIAGLILGLIGSFTGFVGALIVLVFAGAGAAFQVEEAGFLAGLGGLAWVASVFGLIGASIAIAKPRAAVTFMIISAIMGIISVITYIPGAILLIIASIFTFIGRKS